MGGSQSGMIEEGVQRFTSRFSDDDVVGKNLRKFIRTLNCTHTLKPNVYH